MSFAPEDESMARETFDAQVWVLRTIAAGHDPVVVYSADPRTDITFSLIPLGLSRDEIAAQLDIEDNRERIRRYELVFNELERLGRVR